MAACISLKLVAVLAWQAGAHAPSAVLLAFGLWADALLLRPPEKPRVPLKTLASILGQACGLGALALGAAWGATRLGVLLAVRAKGGIGCFAAAARIPLSWMGLDVCRLGGDLQMNSMSGALAFPASFDHVGMGSVLVAAALGLVYSLATLRSRSACVNQALAVAVVALIAMLLGWVLRIALFLACCNFVSYETEELPILVFYRPLFRDGVLVLLFAVLAQTRLFAWRAARRGAQAAQALGVYRPSRRAVAGLCALQVALVLGATWDPVGHRKSGTLAFSTGHTRWSRTDRLYDESWFGPASGYNYNCMKRFYKLYYDVRELGEEITAKSLEGVSVLVVYDPDTQFSDREKAAIRTFVKSGGGLFLIGDHTNVFGSSAHLNGLCQGMGLAFRDDVLFDQWEDFYQLHDTRTEATGFMDDAVVFKFRGPASIQPRSFLTDTINLGNSKSGRAIYSVNNFYPPPHDDPSMACGTFAVTAFSRYGQGRVLAFADSTVFSNFEIFYPGKYEFLLNVSEWLNRKQPAMWETLRGLCLVMCFCFPLAVFVTVPDRRVTLAVLALLVAAFFPASEWRVRHRCDSSRWPAPQRPARFAFVVTPLDDPRFALAKFVPEGQYSERFDVFVQWMFRHDVFPAFAVRDYPDKQAFARALRSAPGVETAVVLCLTEESLADFQDQPSGTWDTGKRFLVLLSGASTDRAKAFLADRGGVRDDAWQEDSHGWLTAVDDQGRHFVMVPHGEQFSDARMGFSEKVVPTDEQRVLYSLQYELLDLLFQKEGELRDDRSGTD